MRRHHCSPPLEPLPARPVRVSFPRGPVAVATNACVRRAKPQLKPTSRVGTIQVELPSGRPRAFLSGNIV